MKYARRQPAGDSIFVYKYFCLYLNAGVQTLLHCEYFSFVYTGLHKPFLIFIDFLFFCKPHVRSTFFLNGSIPLIWMYGKPLHPIETLGPIDSSWNLREPICRFGIYSGPFPPAIQFQLRRQTLRCASAC